MPRPVSFVPVTLALGVLALCGLTRSEAQTASPAAAAHRLTQRRADLEERLRRLTVQIARYIRDPVVHARALVGLALSGELARPGYYSVPADAVIPAVLMAAGGTTHETKLNKLKIQRNGQTIWEGDALRRAIA